MVNVAGVTIKFDGEEPRDYPCTGIVLYKRAGVAISPPLPFEEFKNSVDIFIKTPKSEVKL